jgi:hypothetical protein
MSLHTPAPEGGQVCACNIWQCFIVFGVLPLLSIFQSELFRSGYSVLFIPNLLW